MVLNYLHHKNIKKCKYIETKTDDIEAIMAW